MKRETIAVCFSVLLAAGCATKSQNIAPAYVSSVGYDGYSCDQLAREAQSVSQRAAVASGQQDKQRKNDAVATTVAVVLFWPALFFIDGDGPKAAELSRLKGEMETIERVSIQKNCNIRFQR